MKRLDRWWKRHTFHVGGQLHFEPWWYAPIAASLVVAPYMTIIYFIFKP